MFGIAKAEDHGYSFTGEGKFVIVRNRFDWEAGYDVWEMPNWIDENHPEFEGLFASEDAAQEALEIANVRF